MSPRPLYLVLLLSVLLVTACESEETRRVSVEPTPSDSAVSALQDSLARDSASREKNILVLGNSIAAGYGVSQQQAFPAVLQQKIDSLGLNYNVINAGLSGETTAGGLRRLPWLLRQRIEVLIIELGGNDGLRGVDPAVTKKNLSAIIDTARAHYPETEILLSGMRLPPNLGPEYTERFRSLYPELAKEKNVTLIPFILDDVGGVDSLNQDDGIHPTAQGQRIVAQNVWDKLKPILTDGSDASTAQSADCTASPSLALDKDSGASVATALLAQTSGVGKGAGCTSTAQQ